MTSEENREDHAVQIDYDTRDGEIARRNILFGLWAGRRIGLRGNALETYAWSVHFADQQCPGHDDVVAKVAADLKASGKPMSDRHLRDHLREMAMRGNLDLAQGDRDVFAGGKRSTKRLRRKSIRDVERVDRPENNVRETSELGVRNK